MWRAIASEEVAAGEGALRTCNARSVCEKTKSSISAPSRPSAWARTPAKEGSTSATLELGHVARGGVRRRPNAWRHGAARSAPVAHQCPIILHVPGHANVSRDLLRRSLPRPVGVTGAGDQGGRPDQNVAVDVLGEVHSEEGQGGVGHGVDQGANQVPALGSQPQVGAAEGDDARVGAGAGGDSQPVGPRSRAEDRVGGLGRPVACASGGAHEW